VTAFDLFRAAVEAVFFLVMIALMLAPLTFVWFVPTLFHMRGH
jgi:hypothetical protein